MTEICNFLWNIGTVSMFYNVACVKQLQCHTEHSNKTIVTVAALLLEYSFKNTTLFVNFVQSQNSYTQYKNVLPASSQTAVTTRHGDIDPEKC